MAGRFFLADHQLRIVRDQSDRREVLLEVVIELVDDGSDMGVPLPDVDRVAIGRRRATRPTAMLPPAPPRFSITTGCPSGARMRSAMMRAATSVEPPGGNGTTSVSERTG